MPASIVSLALVASLSLADEGPPPGWAARFMGSGAREDPKEVYAVTTHAEHAAFALGEGESPHPAIQADGFHALYTGELRIARPGRYRFALDVEAGVATLKVARGDGTPAGSVTAGSAPLKSETVTAQSDWIDATPGALVVTIDVTRFGAFPARLRTSWEMKPDGSGGGFAMEPIPASAVRVPAELSPAVMSEFAARRGRVLLTELGCVSCHSTGEKGVFAAPSRDPIALDRVAARAGTKWLTMWMAAPQFLKPGAGMPALLDTKEDVYALLELFESQIRDANGQLIAPAEESAVDPALAERGRELFHEVGCVGCHGPLESPAAAFSDEAAAKALPAVASSAPFGNLGKKWRVGELAAFLRDPRATRPHGRMPSLGLDEPEAAAIAHYLVGKFEPPEPLVATRALAPARVEQGRLVFQERGCASCHTLADSKPATARAKPIAALTPGDLERGCLAPGDSKGDDARGKAPHFELAEPARAELRAAIASVQHAAGAPSPIDATQRALSIFRCTSCHERDRQGGAGEALFPYFKCRAEADLGDEGRLPPRLDGVGQRLQSPWLEKVVGDGARARPYLVARMPAFGHDVGGWFTGGLAALEGEWRSDRPATGKPAIPANAPSSEVLAAEGRKLAGSGGLNCITCHSFGERPSAGTPGLDFTQMGERLRGDWWRRYALAPLRFKPGTRMPSYFENGKSAVVTILEGDATRQIEALWDWLEQARRMPAPEGVPTGRRMVLDVGERPKVFRTFLARAGNRGIAVGFPEGLHFAFDAEQIRLCEAWAGEFLDVAPVWTGRGGNVAPQLGAVVWSAPGGPALLLERPADAWPTDSGRAHGLKFRGYRLERDGSPTFLWELRPAATPADEPPLPGAVQVEERFVPDPRPEILFVRTFTLTNVQSGGSVWAAPFGAKARVTVTGGELVQPKEEGGSPFLEIRPGTGGGPIVVRVEIEP